MISTPINNMFGSACLCLTDAAVDVFVNVCLHVPSQAQSRVRYESTVGAGLPVVASLQRVMSSGDQVTRVCGSLSGTLGYVMAQLQATPPTESGSSAPTFSEVVQVAKGLGYTEPDPRDDLGGVDVARKALILARLLGECSNGISVREAGGRGNFKTPFL
jgi:homoserine dehydrogenase